MTITASTREAYGKALLELGKENPNIVVLDADLAKSTRTILFAKEFPERFFDMGIAEQNMIDTAAGLAICGKIPFASSFAIFATGKAWEQIRNTVAYGNLNVKIVATHGGITVGEDGASHHCTEDIALMRVIPNITIIIPADATETEKAVKAAAEYYGPVYIRLSRMSSPLLFDKDYPFQIGKAYTIKEGKDIAIIATGIMVSQAIDASQLLAQQGISARVINMHTIKPLDKETVVKVAQETKGIVTAEEHSIYGGLGSAVAELLAETIPTPVEMIGVRDSFGQSGTPPELLKEYQLTPNDILQAAKNVLERAKRT